MTEPLASKIGDTVAERHFWLTQGVARAVGVNLTDAMARGALSRAEFAGMVVRCGACEFSENCVRWMAEGNRQTDVPPAYCLNHERIEALGTRLR